jgi:adenosylhomocysteine nucleosidase
MATLLIMALKEESQKVFETNGVQPFYCDIGQVNAAFWTHKLIIEQRPTRIINLGSVGSHTFKQGELVECTSFVQRPANDFYPNTSKILRVPAVTQLPKAICGTGDFIEKAQPLVSCDVMDMEAYAMAYVCEKYKVEFVSIKYVTDYSDTNIKRDWHAHLKNCSEKLFGEYLKLIQK